MKLSLDQLPAADRLAQAGLEVAFKILVALAIFFAGKWLAAFLIGLMRKATQRARVDETLADFLANVAYGVAIAVIVVAAAGTLGVDTTSAAAVLAGAALAIGLSLQSQLSSLAAGVIIILFRPFSKGDDVEIAGIKGTVEEIKIVSTQLRTADNKRVIVPNASITTNIITNYTALGTRRIELVLGVSHGSDLLAAKGVLQAVLDGEPRLLANGERSVRVREITAAAIELDVWGWAKVGELAEVRAALLEAIELRFEAAGVEFATPDGRRRLPTSPPASPPSAGAAR